MDELSDLTPDACRALLGAAGAGRVVHTEHALPAVVPSRIVVRGDRLWFAVPTWTALREHPDGALLAFHVDHVEPARRSGWSVTVLGPARTVPVVAAPAAARALVRAERVLALDAVRFQGRALGVLPPAGAGWWAPRSGSAPTPAGGCWGSAGWGASCSPGTRCPRWRR